LGVDLNRDVLAESLFQKEEKHPGSKKPPKKIPGRAAPIPGQGVPRGLPKADEKTALSPILGVSNLGG
jgi:hypothetical protein